MLKKIILSSLLFSAVTVYASQEEAQELFTDANCMACHNGEDFVAKENKVNNFSKLHKAVNNCRFANDAEWFDDESTDVTKYLNHKYYKFKVPKE